MAEMDHLVNEWLNYADLPQCECDKLLKTLFVLYDYLQYICAIWLFTICYNDLTVIIDAQEDRDAIVMIDLLEDECPSLRCPNNFDISTLCHNSCIHYKWFNEVLQKFDGIQYSSG